MARVHYPGLETHPDHARATTLFGGRFGGVLSFELRGGERAAERLFERVQLIAPSVSLGGVESLMTFPARSSHAGQTPERRAALGVTEGLLRLSVGIEDVQDLEADLRQALE